MKKIALATAALLVAAGAAFAENPNAAYNQVSSQPTVDGSYTASTSAGGQAVTGDAIHQDPNGAQFSK